MSDPVGENLSDLFRLELPCNPDAPYVVRHALGRYEQLERVREDARLIASELVTNAVMHSGCGTDHTIEVRASIGDDHLLISVDDPGLAGKRAELRAAELTGEGGFGLRVVAQIAQRWGSDRPNGHRVWAELALHR
jgi:anti-sigma regulatory factor (Ser/Thr protein kinase)